MQAEELSPEGGCGGGNHRTFDWPRLRTSAGVLKAVAVEMAAGGGWRQRIGHWRGLWAERVGLGGGYSGQNRCALGRRWGDVIGDLLGVLHALGLSLGGGGRDEAL